MLGLGLAAVALATGWAAGSAYDSLTAAKGCVGPCASSPASAQSIDVLGAAFTPEPEEPEPADLPFVSARSIAVIEGGCGALLFGRDEHLPLPPASLAKMMTAAVAADQAELDTMITTDVDSAALYDRTGSTIMGLQPGMQLSLLDLLYGLLLPSGNDAAIAIARGIAGTEAAFVELMNEKARSLALDETHFTNAHGLYDPELQSSAYDMGMLARYVMQNPDLREIVRSVSWQPAWDGPPVWNGNRLISEYEGADGVKIGYTEESQQTIVGSAVRDGRRIIVSLMRSQDRYTDSARMFDWAFAQPSACP